MFYVAENTSPGAARDTSALLLIRANPAGENIPARPPRAPGAHAAESRTPAKPTGPAELHRESAQHLLMVQVRLRQRPLARVQLLRGGSALRRPLFLPIGSQPRAPPAGLGEEARRGLGSVATGRGSGVVGWRAAGSMARRGGRRDHGCGGRGVGRRGGCGRGGFA